MPPQEPQMQTAPDPRAELDRLRKMKRLRELEAKAGAPSLRSETNPIITAQRQSQTQAMSQWAQQQEARKAAEARQAQERREAARSLGGGMDMMVGQDAAGNVRPGSVVDTDLGAGITGSPLSFGQGLAEGAANTANTVFAASTGLGNAALNVFDPNRQQSQPMRIQVPRNALLDDGGALQSMSGTVPRIAGQIAGPRVAIGKVTPGGGFGANAAKDAIAIGAGTPQDMPRISDMFPEGTPIADMLRTREGDNAFTAFGKNAAEDLLSSTVAGGILKGGGMLLDAFGRPRASVQATTAPPVSRASPEVAEAPPQPAPFSRPPEPKPSSFLRNNADRIVTGAVGGFLGSAGDAFAAEGDGSGGGPDIINPYTGAAAGMLGPRFAGQAWRAGRRASMAPAARAAYDQRVSYGVLRNALASAGITSAEQGIAAKIAQYGDKPASVVDLAQGNVGLAANLSRQQGATGEAALARGEQLLGGRAGRLERDIGQAAPGLNPGAITGDVDRMIALAQEQAKPAYDALRQQFPAGSVNSERLAKIEGIGSHIKAVDEYRAATAANEGRAVSDFEYWDLVKRDIDAKEQQLIAAGATMDDIRVRKLEGARAALVTELDDLMPGYAKARQLGGEAPKMREAFKQGQKLLDGNFLADEVSRMISEVTGQQLTATQAGVIRNMMKKTQNGRTAMAALMSSDARKKMEAVFGKEASDAMQARFAADAAIMTNAQRVSPNVGSVSAQALLGEGGGVQQAAELAQQAVAFKTNPLAAVLGALSRSGAYSQAQRDIMGELLLSDDVAGSLNRIFSNRPPRNPLNVEPPPTPQGPPTNALAPRRPDQAGFGGSKPPERRFANEAEADAEYARLAKQIDELDFDGARGNPEAIGAAGGTAIGMATAPDQNGDGVVDAQERMLGGAGGALTGGIAGRGVRALSGRASAAPAGKFRGPNNQTFAGVNAKTADKVALARAQNMEAEGASRDDIWDATGWFKGVDGKWRFEIDDSGSRMSDPAVNNIVQKGKTSGKVAGVLQHKELYEAYPELRDTDALVSSKPPKGVAYRGVWNSANGVYPRAGVAVETTQITGPHNARGILLHEMGGHGVQDIEGFATGGAPDTFKSSRFETDVWREAHRLANADEQSLLEMTEGAQKKYLAAARENLYTRLAGEVEARNVQTRRNFTPEERRARRPWQTQDVPDDQQIVRFGGGKAESRSNGPPLNKLTPPR